MSVLQFVPFRRALRALLALPVLALLAVAPPALADDAPTKPAADAAKPADTPKAEQSVTQGKLPLPGGAVLDYTATAGTLIVRDNDDKPIASIGLPRLTVTNLSPTITTILN